VPKGILTALPYAHQGHNQGGVKEASMSRPLDVDPDWEPLSDEFMWRLRTAGPGPGPLSTHNSYGIAQIVWPVIRRRLSHWKDHQEDVLQNTLIAIMRGLPTFDPSKEGRAECKFEAWAQKIAERKCLDFLRMVKRDPISLEDWLEGNDDDEQSPRQLASTEPSPESQLEIEEAIKEKAEKVRQETIETRERRDRDGQHFERALEKLENPRYRMVICARFEHQISQGDYHFAADASRKLGNKQLVKWEDVAARTGIPLNSCKRLHTPARQELSRQWWAAL
jgi:RNA polymerase sigma factor (sigma-70 family)